VLEDCCTTRLVVEEALLVTVPVMMALGLTTSPNSRMGLGVLEGQEVLE
jgi:hypothetical protein